MQIVKTLTFVKSTAGTHVFGEPRTPEAIFPALYIPKSAFPNPAQPPMTITVTVEIKA